jgi:intracellular sulfur oxidation DsrE/DsrF family protein
MTYTKYSDEVLNAYIDGELDQAEALEITERMSKDPELRRRVEELQVVKNLVRLSYSKEPVNESAALVHARSNTRKQQRLKSLARLAIAASVLLSLGLVTGWYMNHYLAHDSLLKIANHIDLAGAAKEKSKNIVIQVSTKDQYRWNTILNEVENTLKNHNRESGKLRLHLVTNAQGIQMASTRQNPYADRIQRLIKKYPNFALQVCKQTLNRMYKEKKIKPDLLPGAEVVPSALGEVMKKRSDGWIYIKI